jgi:hypothetical protein
MTSGQAARLAGTARRGNAFGAQPGVLVLIHDRDRVESGSRLPRRSVVVMP